MAKSVRSKRDRISKVETTETFVEKEAQLLFGKTNYVIVLVGLAFIFIGFLLMAGGGSSDPNVFDAEAIYSFRRITLAPILIIAGLAIEIFAIVKKS